MTDGNESRIVIDLEDYQVVEASKVTADMKVRSFGDEVSAAHFLRDHVFPDLANRHTMESILMDRLGVVDISRLDEQERIQRLVEMMTTGRLVFVKVARAPLPVWDEPLEAEELDAPPVESEEPLSWIKFQVVDDATDQPIADVELKATGPDGSDRDFTTDSDGYFEIRDIQTGSYSIDCDLEGATLEDTLGFVSIGKASAAASNGDGVEGESVSGSRIAKIEEHKVRAGEDLEILANRAGMSWQDLAEFNWGTSAPEEINEHLRDDVGCTTKADDGVNYRFDDSDDPGIVLIPKPWSKGGLATEKTHTIRVKRILAPVAYSLTVEIPLDEIFLEAVEDDEALLEATDGTYRKKLMVYETREEVDDEYVRLVFRGVIPHKEYTLTYDTKEDDEGTEVAKVIMFHSKLIEAADLENPIKLDSPFEESKEI